MKLAGEILFLIATYVLLHVGSVYCERRITRFFRRAFRRAAGFSRRSTVEATEPPPLENPHLR